MSFRTKEKSREKTKISEQKKADASEKPDFQPQPQPQSQLQPQPLPQKPASPMHPEKIKEGMKEMDNLSPGYGATTAKPENLANAHQIVGPSGQKTNPPVDAGAILQNIPLRAQAALAMLPGFQALGKGDWKAANEAFSSAGLIWAAVILSDYPQLAEKLKHPLVDFGGVFISYGAAAFAGFMTPNTPNEVTLEKKEPKQEESKKP